MKNKAFIAVIAVVIASAGLFLGSALKTGAYGNCNIYSFYPSPANISYGGTTTLMLSTSGCQSLMLSGGTYTNYYIASGTSMSVGPLYTNTTYTVTGFDSYGVRTDNTTTVYVGSSNGGNQNGNGTAVTNPATNVTANSATLNGYINQNSCGYYSYCSNPTSYYFLYGTTQYSLNNSTGTLSTPTGSGPVTMQVYGLQPNTTYYYQLVTNSYGTTQSGAIVSFYTQYGYNNNQTYYNQTTAITSVATNVTSTSARLNGIVTTTGTGATTYFEYGTSTAFGYQTSAQNVLYNTVSNYYDVINTTPNTTYYYRIVGISNGQKQYGETATFTTDGAYTYVPTYVPPTTTTVVTNMNASGTGSGTALASLAITNQSGSIVAGSAVNYSVTYQNISNYPLSGAVLNVILPKGLVYQSASLGVPTTDNTVAVALGTMVPGQSGSLFISTMAEPTITDANNMVAEAVLAFTSPSGAQDSAIAYALNNWNGNTQNGNNNLAGLALFGVGFFPGNLLGWILLIGILVVIVLIARYFLHAGAPKPAPATHVYYATPPTHDVDGVHSSH